MPAALCSVQPKRVVTQLVGYLDSVKCGGCDAVIFSLDDGTFAQVHLTWAHHTEPGPWPATQRFGGFLALETAIDNHQH